jgi:hypothetical protein
MAYKWNNNKTCPAKVAEGVNHHHLIKDVYRLLNQASYAVVQ